RLSGRHELHVIAERTLSPIAAAGHVDRERPRFVKREFLFVEHGQRQIVQRNGMYVGIRLDLALKVLEHNVRDIFEGNLSLRRPVELVECNLALVPTHRIYERQSSELLEVALVQQTNLRPT